MAMIHEITVLVGKHKRRRRIGRGPGSGRGKTAGRGHKGAGSRSGFSGSIHPLYEGGQMPYFRRIPKRGFNNYNFRNNFAVINVKVLETYFADGDTVDIKALADKHLVPNDKLPLKVLGEGELTKKLTVKAAKLSASAKEKIEQAGGTVELVECKATATAKPEKKKSAAKSAPKAAPEATPEAE